MLRRFSRAGAGDKKKQPEEPEEDDPIRREPLPLGRAVLWKPLPDSYHFLASMMRTREHQAQLFITQRAFLQIERHLGSAPELELGGFLAGHMCQCPRSGIRYSIVNTVVPFAEVSGDPLGARVTPEAYKRVRSRLDAHRLALIGWYRNGSGLGLQLLPDDVETHLAYFNHPWQTTMLVVPDPSKSKGAFFTYDPRVGRSYCIPFYELFDTHAAESNRLGRTCVTWTTYVAAAAVEPLEAKDRDVVAMTVTPNRSKPEPLPPEPIDEWLDAIKDPWVRLKDVAVSATTRRDDTLPLVYGPAVRPAVEPPPPARLPLVLPAPVAQEKESPRREPNRPAPPFAGPARATAPPPATKPPAPPRQASPAAAPVAETGASERATSGSPPLASPPLASPPPASAPPIRRAAARKPPPRPLAVALPEPPSAPPAVALPPDFHDDALRWQRRRRIGFAFAAASFLAAIVLSNLRSRPQTVAEAATNGAIEAAPPVAVPASMENGHAPIPLASAVDSLSAALAYYRDVEGDHRQGLVGCRVLDRAYAVVGRARNRVDSVREQVGGTLNDADSIRVSMLGAEYTHVNETYRRSDCRV